MSIKYDINYSNLEGGAPYVSPDNWLFWDDIPDPSTYFMPGPTARVVSYSQRNGRDIINYGTINSFTPITDWRHKDKNPFKLGITLDSNPNTPLSLPAQNYRGMWNLVDDDDKFNLYPEAKTAYENGGKDFFIILPISNSNDRVNERVNLCNDLGGPLPTNHPPHLTLYSGKLVGDIEQAKNSLNKTALKEIFLAMSNIYDKGTRAEHATNYKFLGRNLPDGMKDEIFTYHNDMYNVHQKIINITGLGEEELGNSDVGDVYLARIFFGGKKDFSYLYSYIKHALQGVENLVDGAFYSPDMYDEFQLHLSIGKFTNLRAAADALESLYSAEYQDLGENFFNRNKVVFLIIYLWNSNWVVYK